MADKTTNIDVHTLIQDVVDAGDKQILLDKTLVEWRTLLAEECQVYVFNESYIAKRFDHINYVFCDKQTAKEILIDNLYALLRYKYFTKQDEVVDEKINEIVRSFTTNLKSTLKRVSLNEDAIAQHVSMIPDTCIAFRNGVYDFAKNDWLFRYKIINIESLSNVIYLYDKKYVVLWYVDINFEPLPINIMETGVEDFVKLMQQLTKKERNLCFELMYNMGHDINDKFNIKNFTHLCEVMGYTVCQSFVQKFVIFVGAGGNGKNTLFDGAFSSRVIPAPASNDLTAIEQDKFITGALENKFQNIYLETSTKGTVYEESQHLKDLTGSTIHTIEHKGINKYTSYLNVKVVTSANDQDALKFKDTSPGFMRRVNVIELFYRWDPDKMFLQNGDYYDTSFSDDYREMKNDINNTIMFIYFAMYGLKNATKNFSQKFEFSTNDWKLQYSDVDLNLRERVERISLDDIVRLTESSISMKNDCKELFYDTSDKPVKLYTSDSLIELKYSGYDDMLKMIKDEEASSYYFANYDVYMSLKILKLLCRDIQSDTSFTQSVKKLYKLNKIVRLGANKAYVKVRFDNRRLKIIN